MSPDPGRKKKKHAEFWRACRFLGPYRRLVVTSVLCAFLAGLIMTGGLAAMLPILRVLINGDTLQSWIDRQVAEHQYGVTLAPDPDSLRVIKVDRNSPAAEAGIRAGDTSLERVAPDSTNPIPWHLRVTRDIVYRLPSHPVKAIAAVFFIIFGTGVIGNIVRFFQEYLSDKAAISAVNDIRKRLYDHVLHIPIGFFGLRGTSDVTSRLVQDAQGLQDGFKTVLGQSIQEPIRAALYLCLAMILSWKLTLFVIIFAPFMMMAIRKFGKKMRRASRAALQNSSSMLGQIEGTLIGIRVVKSVGAERFERRRYAKIMSGLRTQQLKMARLDALSTPTLETLATLVVGCVLIYASYLVLVTKTIDASTFFMVMACLVGIGESLRKVSKVNNVLQKSNAAAGRIFETMDVPVERARELRVVDEDDDRGRTKLPTIQKEIRFENVTFSYPNATTPAVIDVNLVVPRGQSIAMVGRNGSGKTTLVAMLPRFYDPQAGRVMIDGIDVRRATLRSLRKQIGIVTQDSVIFPGTIAQNIAYGDARPIESIRDEIEAAAKRAFCHEFIMEKSLGYDTPLDGLGGQLSGGQKQRLNIARAILRQAPILILDEATSQVDAESEHLIQQAIESLMHERTTFVIAHRFSTITSADTIVVLDRGRLVGQGRHDQLLRTCETYQQLYERQIFTPG